jgi:hypothetical protein
VFGVQDAVRFWADQEFKTYQCLAARYFQRECPALIVVGVPRAAVPPRALPYREGEGGGEGGGYQHVDEEQAREQAHQQPAEAQRKRLVDIVTVAIVPAPAAPARERLSVGRLEAAAAGRGVRRRHRYMLGVCWE